MNMRRLHAEWQLTRPQTVQRRRHMALGAFMLPLTTYAATLATPTRDLETVEQ